LNGDDDHPILVFNVDINDEHPTPGAQDETKTRPSASKLRPEARKASQQTDGPPEALLRVLWEAMCEDELIEVCRR
jgi:hypothetical protein